MKYPKIETLYKRDEQGRKLLRPLILKNPIYDIPKTWRFTEKVDGTNIRIMWDCQKVTFGGRTDKATLPKPLDTILGELFPAEAFFQYFPETPLVVFGEGYGPKIQKGGGLYCDKQSFIGFDVYVNNTHWADQHELQEIASYLVFSTVPEIMVCSLEEATEFVQLGFVSAVAAGRREAEGFVGKPLVPLFDSFGNRLIIKLKTKDFG